MSAHDAGPWSLWGRPDPSQVIAAQSSFVVQTLGGNDVANAHRIVTCVNACEGLPQDALDGGWTAAGISAYASKLKRHNADLIEALQMIADVLERVGDTRPHKDGQYIDAAREAIAKAGA